MSLANEESGGAQVGVDVGSSLTKFAVRNADGQTRFQLLGRGAYDEVARTLDTMAPESVGLTGGGAAKLASMLDRESVQVNEFTAWGMGARVLSKESEVQPYLLVSLGTGTSVMVIDGTKVTRAGGTALGGGTILGLGAALLGSTDFAQTCALAARGSRDSVDLLVRDLYPEPGSPLNGDLTAASFGRLGRQGSPEETPLEDLAAAIMRLVGENVALIAGGHAHRARIDRIVFGGSTLRGNPLLADVLTEVTKLLGLQAAILKDGEFAGAVGALEWAPQGESLQTGLIR